MAKKPAKWEEELEKEATADAAREKARTGGTGNKVSIKNRRFTFGGENMGRELVGVIVDFAYLRTWFATKFDPDKPGVPQCWALSEDGEAMAPPDTVEDQQSTACEGCPMNEWESGKGRAKACGDRRRLGFLHEDDIKTAEDVEEAIAAMIEIPPTSTGTWATYLKELKTKHKRPIYSVLTKLSFDPEVSYAKVVFEFEEKIDDEDVVSAIKERRDGVREMLMEPFDDSNGGSEKPKKKKKVVDEDEDDEPPRKKKRVVDEDEDDEDEKPTRRKRTVAEDDDEDEEPRKQRRKSADDDDDDGEPTPKKRRSRDASDDDEDEEPRSKRGGSRKATRDDDDEDKPTRKRKPTVDEDDADDEEDEAPVKRRKKVVDEDEDDEPPKRKKKVVDEDEDEDDAPKSRKRSPSKDDDDDEDEPKRKKRGSRFSK